MGNRIFKNIYILHLAYTKNCMPLSVFLSHFIDDLSHIGQFLLISFFRPPVTTLRKKILIILLRIVIDIEQILEIVEPDYMLIRF